MFFMPGKPLSNTMLLLTLYAASEAVKRLRPGQLLFDAPGWSKYLALLGLLVGLFLDEMPITTFFVLPLLFWSAFVPAWPWVPQLIASVSKVPCGPTDPAPAVQLATFATDGLELNVLFWIADPENGQGSVKSDVNLALLRTLNAAGIEIPYPQRVVRTISVPAAE